MSADAVYGSLPFKEQIDFFRQKLNLPTESWTDIWHEQHDRSFVVAGAMRDDLLGDFRTAVDKAISQGTTLEEFRKDFDTIVERYGWEYNGGRNWRSKVIYDRNLASSYSAGRWQQIQAVKRQRPYLRYRHMPDERYPRLEHMAWDGMILPVDHPFWLTHFPQCDWGCQCWVDSLSLREIVANKWQITPDDGVDHFVTSKWSQMQQAGLVGADEPAPVGMRTVTVGQNGPNPRTVEVPAGVGPGFGYVPGASLADPGADVAELVQSALEKTAELTADVGAQSAAETLALPLVQSAIDSGFAEMVSTIEAAGQATNDSMLVGALSPNVVQALTDAGIEVETAPIVARDVEVLHALRDAKVRAVTASGYRKALTSSELAQLPAMIEHASAVILDASDSTLLYVFAPDNGPRDAVKIVVRVNFTAKLAGRDGKVRFNAFRTASWLDRADLEQLVGSGGATLIEGEL